MTFIHDGGYWESVSGTIFHSVPGNEDAPNPESINFVLSKYKLIDHYFEFCSDELLLIAQAWDSIDKSLTAKELFKVSAISVETAENKEWEICLETRSDFKWIHVGLQFEGEKIVSNDIST